MNISTRSAITISVLIRYASLAMQFVSTMILARLLTPEEIGIYSAGFSIIAFAHLFRDFGLNQYLIQEKHLDNNKIRATFTLSILFAWALGLLIFLLSATAAEFFNEPGIELLLHLLSINFFIIPFGSITLALLRRNLKFHINSGIEISASVVGITTTVWSAYEGAQYLSLAYGAIAETSVTVLISTYFRPKDINLMPSFRGIKQVLKFGSIVGLGNIVIQLSVSITDILVAKILGLNALGFFSRAIGTFSLFNHIFISGIRPIVLPLFSRSNKDPDLLAKSYLTAATYTVVIAWPFFLFLFLFTEEIVRVLYGSQWDAAIPLVKILCSAGIFLPAILFSENVFIAYGRPDITLKILSISNVTKISLVLPACFHGLNYVCAAFAFSFMINFLVSLKYLKSVLNIKIQQMAKIAVDALPSVFLAILPTYLLSFLISAHVESTVIRLILLMICAFLGWVIGLVYSKHAFVDEIKLFLGQKSLTIQHNKE